MKTIVISDTALLAHTYEETVEGILYLRQLQNLGYKIILLSNWPEYCMRIIGGRCNGNEEVSYEYLGTKIQAGSKIDIKLFNDTNLDKTFTIRPNYNIFGNGIKVSNQFDDKVYEGNYMSEEMVQQLIDSLRNLGYVSLEEQENLAKVECEGRYLSSDENVYKFFNSTIESATPYARTYGMQCNSRGSLEDIKTILAIEAQMPSIVGYELNGKPCFFQKDVNKKAAFEHLTAQEHIDINRTYFVLSEATDSDIANKYSNTSYIVSRDVLVTGHVEKAPSLAKALYKIDRRNLHRF